MRICIVAENASTRFGGEAILPVHYFRQLRSRGVECWLIVHARVQMEVEGLFPQELDRIVFVPDTWLQKHLFSLGSFLPDRLSESTLGLINQLITQFHQRVIARRLIRNERIDVVHQPIPVSPRFPSAMFGLGVPVVIGPLNGGMEYPPAFRRTEKWMSRSAIAITRRFVNVGNTLLPGKKRASVVLVANDRTRKALPSGLRGEIIELVENGIDVGVWQATRAIQIGTNSRFIFLGRLVDWKAVDVVIRALQELPTAELEVIGDGPMLRSWRTLASELGLKDRVHFTGWLPQQECAARLRDSVALVLPSLYECGGAVVLEAMSMGKPVIATDWGGPADYLDTSCGVLIAPDSYTGLVAGFASAMRKMIDSPELPRVMGAAGRERAIHDYDWQRKIDQVISIYRALLEKLDVCSDNHENQTASVVISRENQKLNQ
ncbi:MAG: glycosyltransferase family 4 protein [Terracidiphilus sp.]